MRKSTDGKAAARAAILATRRHRAQACAIQRSIAPEASVACRRVVVLQPMNERGKRAEKMSQQRRLGAALRENLKRRKAQAKARATGSGPAGAAKSHDSAGIAGHKQQR